MSNKNRVNSPIIIKDFYETNYSDMIQEVLLDEGIKGEYYNSGYERYFNHIKHNGKLITDKSEVKSILFKNHK